MKSNVDKLFLFCIYITILTKVLFLITAICYKYFHHYSSKYKHLDYVFNSLRVKTELLFNILIAFWFIYLFNPWHDNLKYITKELGFVFYVYGFYLLINVHWKDLFHF
jgi:hypothetical protein